MKKTYKSIYSFNVFDEIKKYKKVYVSDKENKTIRCVNGLSVEDFADMLNTEDVSTRFDFWVEE